MPSDFHARQRLEQCEVHRVLDRTLVRRHPLRVPAADVDGAVAAGVEVGEVGHGISIGEEMGTGKGEVRNEKFVEE